MGKHGGATIAISGAAGNVVGGRPALWELQVMGREVPVDDDLRKAMPPGLSKLLTSMKLKGKLAFDFTKLNYRAGVPNSSGAAVDGDVDLLVSIWFTDASMEAGGPITDANGIVKLDATMREGKLSPLKGRVQARSLTPP